MAYSVFVLMPFDEQFNEIYNDFLKATFESIEEVQFQVDRASDIENQRSILNDIVIRIAHSDLIVADLTGCNPNVFYELGLAHALRRPVILLTQDIEEIPFDLQPYRVLEYDTHFAKIQCAKEILKDYARKFARSEMQFGNPVKDYLPGSGELAQVQPKQEERTQEDDRGFLDHVIDIVEGYDKLATIAASITESMERDVSRPMGVATEAIEKLTAGGRTADPRAAQAVARRLARHVTRFNGGLAKANREYEEILQNTEHSLEFVALFAMASDEQSEELEQQFTHLWEFKNTALSTRDACVDLALTSDELPRIERRLNRALGDLSDELRDFGGNLDRTVASVTRALNIWEGRRKSD